MDLNKIDAIILAGGKGTRMRRLAHYLPKSLLPIYDEPLISKQLQILNKYNIKRIIISFDPAHAIILKTKIINPLQLKTNIIIEPDYKQKGPVPAFLSIVKKYKIIKGLLILGDIFCLNKMDYLCGLQSVKNNMRYIILQTIKTSKKEIVKGCNVIINKQNQIKSIIEKPLMENIKSPWAWTGIAFFPDVIYSAIRNEKLKNKYFLHVGDLFNSFLLKDTLIVANKTLNKVNNLNSPEDLLVASVGEKNQIQILRKNNSHNHSKKLNLHPNPCSSQ